SYVVSVVVFIFFFQAEDGIRDFHVTGVQTCALPILAMMRRTAGFAGPVAAAPRPSRALQSPSRGGFQAVMRRGPAALKRSPLISKAAKAEVGKPRVNSRARRE